MEWWYIAGTVLTGLCSVAAVVLSNVASNREMSAKLDKTQAIFEATVTEEITSLRKQVEKHNNVLERVYGLEKNDAVQDTELKRLNKRMEIMESKEAK